MFAAIMIIFKTAWIKIFTEKDEMIELINDNFWVWLLWMCPLDGPPWLLMFYLNGLEERNFCMIASFISLVVISLPLTYYLAVVLNWQLFGIFFSFGFCNLIFLVI